MNPRQLKWAAAALLVAVIVWIVSEQTSEQPDDRETGRVMPEQVEGVDRIVFGSSTDEVTVMRNGTTWTVNGFTIDNARLATLLTALQDSADSEIVATSAALHGRMGVDGTGTTVTFFRGNDLVATVLFGNRGADNSSMYARNSGEDLVYRYDGSLTQLVELRVNDWRSKVLADVPVATIDRIEVDRAGETYALFRQGESWALSSGAPIDSAKVAMMVVRFQPLQARRIAKDEHRDLADFRTPERRITLFDAAGGTLAAIVYDSLPGEDGFAVHTRGDDTVYHMPRWNIDQIMPPEEMLQASD
jgi:hypothetical protein